MVVPSVQLRHTVNFIHRPITSCSVLLRFKRSLSQSWRHGTNDLSWNLVLSHVEGSSRVPVQKASATSNHRIFKQRADLKNHDASMQNIYSYTSRYSDFFSDEFYSPVVSMYKAVSRIVYYTITNANG